MSTRISPVGYTNSVQTLTVYPLNKNAQITAYLWGGGGGGGVAGSGYGGGFSIVKFGCNKGDNLLLAVGGGGGSGLNKSNALGGIGGSSYVGYSVFNTRNLVKSNQHELIEVSSGHWGSFMNSYAVGNISKASNLDVSTVANFPITGVYAIQTAATNHVTVYIDGVVVASCVDSFTSSIINNVSVSSGDHTLRIVGYNPNGSAGVAVAINSGTSFSGAPGGSAGPQGGSSGGGGGGSTLLIQNNSLQAVAGGGGGAGADTDFSGTNGRTNTGFNGEYGASHPTIGGGGGGGGGYDGTGGGGGNGGAYGAGNSGASWSWSYPKGFDPSGRKPGKSASIVPAPGAAVGGSPGRSGGNGYAIIQMDVPGIFVNIDGVYYSTKEIWVNDQGTWKKTNSIYVNINGVWTPTAGQEITSFQNSNDGWGMVPRSTPYANIPLPLAVSNGGTRGGDQEHSEGNAGTFGTAYSGTPSDNDGKLFY